MNGESTFGIHKLLTLQSSNKALLTNVSAFVNFSEELVLKYGMEQVGIVSHVFDTSGYTVAICLKESHICVHTWPEIGSLTLDVYLCNYHRNNEQNVRDVSQEYVQFFQGQIIKEQEISR